MKEYLLLRNNTELGHYSLDELREMGLRAYDLIWIENKSFSWKYPSEISELAMFAPPVQIPSFDDTQHSEGRLVQMTGNGSEEKTAGLSSVSHEAHVPVTSASHIVALKPKVDHIRIKTIKSSAQSNIVKVEVREEALKESNPFETAVNAAYMYADPAAVQDHAAGFIQQPVSQSGGGLRFLDTFYALSNNNKMEMVVLAVGAVSLLAVVYLFITTGY